MGKQRQERRSKVMTKQTRMERTRKVNFRLMMGKMMEKMMEIRKKHQEKGVQVTAKISLQMRAIHRFVDLKGS